MTRWCSSANSSEGATGIALSNRLMTGGLASESFLWGRMQDRCSPQDGPVLKAMHHKVVGTLLFDAYVQTDVFVCAALEKDMAAVGRRYHGGQAVIGGL